MLFESMFSEVGPSSILDFLADNEIPQAKPYLTDPTGQSQVRDFDHLIQLINHVLTTAPCWTDAAHGAGLVGVPVNAILDWPMATPAGFTVFQDPDVNREVNNIAGGTRPRLIISSRRFSTPGESSCPRPNLVK